MDDHIIFRLLAEDKSLRSYDKDGRLHVALTPISKATVNPYRGDEIPGAPALGLDPARIYYLLRDPEELAKAAATSNNIPLMNLHIRQMPDAPEQDSVVGSTGTDAVFDPPYLRNSLVIWVRSAIESVLSNEKRELSCSYHYKPDMTPGVYQGHRYDGVMREIHFNHVALVVDGRAGPDVLVEDALPPGMGGHYPTEHKMTVSKKALLVHSALADYTLAADAKPEDVQEFLDRLAKLAVDEMEPAPMDKKAKDKSAKDESEEEDKDEDEEEEKKKDAKDKRAKDKSAKDEDPEEEEEEEEERKKKAADKRAKDKRAKDESEEEEEEKKANEKRKDAEDKRAMDAAIGAALAVDRQNTRNIYEALRIVRPFAGELQPMAFDSADAVYRSVLEGMGVDLKGVHPSAFKHILQAQQKPAGQVRLASDSSGAADFSKRFPAAAAVRRI